MRGRPVHPEEDEEDRNMIMLRHAMMGSNYLPYADPESDKPMPSFLTVAEH